MPLGFPPDGFESGLRYAAEPGDIFVCTYPKCGTTWMQYIVYLLLHDGRPLAAGESLGEVFPHLEEVGREAVAALPRPRLIKTHLPRGLAPFAAAARYIHVARNPFDCAVSFYHHTRGFPQHYDFADGAFADFFECFIAGEVDFGDYFDHLLSWYEQAGADNVLFVTYESMKADTRGAVCAVARFLGEPARTTAQDDAKVGRILEAVSFSSMREDQRRWSSARPKDMPEFVRKGSVGDWQTLFTRPQRRRLLAQFKNRTQGTAAAGLWPDIMAAAGQ
jgi:LPS sulfotransferase NodH